MLERREGRRWNAKGEGKEGGHAYASVLTVSFFFGSLPEPFFAGVFVGEELDFFDEGLSRRT